MSVDEIHSQTTMNTYGIGNMVLGIRYGMIGFFTIIKLYIYSCCTDLLMPVSAESGESRKDMYRSYLISKSKIIKLQ